MNEFYNESHITSYAQELLDDLNRYIELKKNIESGNQDRYNLQDEDEFYSDKYENIFDKIEEKLSFWVLTYPDNITVMTLAYRFSKYIENQEDMQFYRDEIININKQKLERPIKERKQLAEDFNSKVVQLKKTNTKYLTTFLGIVCGLIGILLLIFFLSPIDSIDPSNFIIFFFTKITVSSTIVICILWIARFFNRRIHENIHLIEEYEHRAMLFNSFDTIKDSISEDMQKEYFQKMIVAIIENPTYALHRKKADKIPTEIIELAKILNPKQ